MMRILRRSKNYIFSANTRVTVPLKAILPFFLVLVAAAIVACGLETPRAGPEPGVEGIPPTAVASRGAEPVPQATAPARVDRQKPPQTDTSAPNTAPATDAGRAASGKGIDSVEDVQIAAVVQEPAPADTAEALEALVDFTVRAKLSNLSILEIFSGGFRQELLSPDVQVDSESFEQLLAAWDRLAPIRDRTLGAIDRLDQQSLALEVPSGKGLGLAAPTAGPFDAVRDAAIEFFGWVDGSGERSRSRILAIADALAEADRNQLYGEWKQFYSDQAPGVKDADDFFNRLRGGALDSMASRLHTQLLDVSATSVDSPQYANLAQDQNALLTQVAFEEGAEGVVKGAKFNVEASFAALNAQFPGISEGRGYTDKADKWLEYGQQVYQDPTGAAADLLRSQLESQISQPFGSASAGIGEAVGELLAEAVSSIASQTPGFGAPSGDLVGGSGIAGLDREARTAVAIRQDEDGTGPLISVAVPDLEDPIIILPEGEYSVVSFDDKNSVASSGEIVIETGWEKPVSHPLAGIPSQELRLDEIKVQAEEGRLGPETVTIWKRVRTDVNPDNDPTEVHVDATRGRFEGSHNNWDISETSFSHKEKYVDNGYFYYDITTSFEWDAPPEEMKPGEEVELVVTGELSGSHTYPGGTGDSFEYRTKGAGLIHTKNDSNRNIKVADVWADGVREGKKDDVLAYRIVAPKSTRGTFEVYAFLWNRSGADVTWVYEAQEVEVPPTAPPPHMIEYWNSIKAEYEAAQELPEVREECRELRSRLLRGLCDRLPEIEATVDNLLHRNDTALQGLQQPRNCAELPTEGERLGCSIGTVIAAQDVQGCRELFEGEARRFCLLGIAGSFGRPEIILDQGDETLMLYVASTGDLSIADQITDPALHDMGVAYGGIFRVAEQLFDDSDDARVPPANFCSRLRGGYDPQSRSFLQYLSADGDETVQSAFASNRNFCEDNISIARVLHTMDPAECDAYAQRIDAKERTHIAPTEQGVRDFHRQDCLAVIADVKRLLAQQ